MAESRNITRGYLHFEGGECDSILPLYPVDISNYFVSSEQMLDNAGGLCQGTLAECCHPTAIAQHALARLNQYLTSGEENHRRVFLEQACRLVEHEVLIDNDAGGWPIFFSQPVVHPGSSYLSASAQGSNISVLTRAYRLTQKKEFLEVARRAVRTFERDILDGGISTPIGENRVFFEDVAVYPAAHMLSGFIVALFGLYDYVALTGESHIQELIDRSLVTMHELLDEFDTGYWAYADLLSRRLASPSQLTQQASLLEALAGRSACKRCSIVASRWKNYQRRRGTRLRHHITTRWTECRDALLERVREEFFPKPRESPLKRVCVPLPSFPCTGGVLTVLEGIAQATKGEWQLEYLTAEVGPNSEGFIIHQFSASRKGLTQFPAVWFYFLNGLRKIIALMRNRAGYHVILPQDGVFTAAFASLAAKLVGIRVVCIDHGELTLRKSYLYRIQRKNSLAARPLPVRLIGRLRFALYWPSLYLLERISACLVDHFLIPGIEGDEEEENCKGLGIPPSRLTRFASMIEIERHFMLDTVERAKVRESYNIPAEAIVVAIICRLSPEKGLDIALESISQAVYALSPEQAALVHIIIAGDGPLRQSLEESVCQLGLEQTCVFWGDIPSEKVLSLLAMSDIFLYTSTRGACFPMAVLEAMASGCAVIASEQPVSNAVLLAEERGIAVAPGNVEQTSKAFVRLLKDPDLCHRMGLSARNYIAVHHSAANFKRNLMRVTSWAALDDLLLVSEKRETDKKELAD